MRVLITGTAGFIGFHTALKFIRHGHQVLGIDNINDYYSVELKLDRLKESGIVLAKGNDIAQSTLHKNYSFAKIDLADLKALSDVWTEFKPEVVINLAAQAGVRYSMQNPHAYTQSNLVGFMNVLELARQNEISHFVYASSSSVYGLNTIMPFAENHPVDHPASLYAATKRANELLAHSYSNLYALPTTGLRFFTVYGPWGRPDMLIYKLAEAIRLDQPIDIYMHGDKSLWRDYTYIDDIVDGVYKIALHKPSTDTLKDSPDKSTCPFAVYNIGNNSPVQNTDIVASLQKHMGKTAKINYMQAPKTEPFKTFANTDALFKAVGYKPSTNYDSGIQKFVEWYQSYLLN